jgi:predicted extracellular nuclease
MRIHLRALVLIIAAIALAVGGCRDTSGTGPGGNGNGSGPDGGPGVGGDGGDLSGEVTIQQLQSDAVAVGAPVTLRSVVVVAVDTYGGRRGSVYVMEPEGGPYSGVLVFLRGTQAAGLSPGDLIDVEGGIKQEFSFDADDSGRSLTQVIQPAGGEVTLTKVGEGEVPEPELVDPAVLAADDDEAAKWESVLVRIEEVAVERGVRQIGGDETFQEIRVTGPMLVASELAPLAPDDEEPQVGDCYASITGIITYAFDYQLLPRETDDLVRDDEACPEVEADTVRAVKQGDDYEIGDDVFIRGAVVTMVHHNGSRVLIQDQVDEPEEFNGILVFRGNSADPLPEGFGVGSIVDVRGTLGEFNGTTQITGGPQITLREDDPVEPTIFREVAIALLADVEDGAPYEQSLVELTNVEVSDEDDTTNGGFLVSDGGDGELLISDFFISGSFPGGVEVGACFATLRGTMDRTDLNNRPVERRLNVRGEDGDLELGGDCGDD